MSNVLVAICVLYAPAALSKVMDPSTISALEPGALRNPGLYNEFGGCQEFRAEGTTGSGWLLEDCVDVWRSWAPTVKTRTAMKTKNRRFFQDVSDRLRRQGTPCFVESPWSGDGAGSRTMRYLATWIFAEEMGCDCLLPKGYQSEFSTDDTLYCHRGKYIKDTNIRCASVDWIGFFNMSTHMKPFPGDGQRTHTIDMEHGVSELRNATDHFVQHGGFEQPPWVHWILNLVNPIEAGAYVARPDTWTAEKLEAVRDILERMRRSFWWQSRLSDDQVEQDCKFESSRTNIAIHVRLGDRDSQSSDKPQNNGHVNHDDYFDKLEDFMEDVSTAARRQGETSPVFHIFSETSAPCPSTDTGTFHEFPRWRVQSDQIDPCVDAVPPDDCWEKTQGAPSCPSPRPGVFHVQGKSLYLHVGLDVENAMSCMIKADGIMMGCSTFGQVAGLFSEGLRFFSVGCEGWATAPHYQMIPPMVQPERVNTKGESHPCRDHHINLDLARRKPPPDCPLEATAERGNMWVPVSGSWRNPIIYSERILDAALSQFFEKSVRLQLEVPQP